MCLQTYLSKRSPTKEGETETHNESNIALSAIIHRKNISMVVNKDFPKTLYLSKFHFQQYVEVHVGVISECKFSYRVKTAHFLSFSPKM